MLMAVGRRARQFFEALTITESAAQERDGALALLNAQQRRLFYEQTPRDRKHALVCARNLGDADDDLRIAALLHDVAKGDMRAHERAVFVLLSAAPGRLLRRLAAPDGAHWRRSLDAALRHAERGAEAVRLTGASDGVVRLIRDHHAPFGRADERLQRLIRADDRA